MSGRRPFVIVAGIALLTLGSQCAADWPQWRGPTRDGLVADVSPPKPWPAELDLGWQAYVGSGSSAPIVVGERVIIFTRRDEEEAVTCLSLADGEPLWRKSYEVRYDTPATAAEWGPGPKSTPVAADGRVYTLGITGILTAWELETGKRLWRKNFGDEFKLAPLGAAMSPLVDDGKLYVQLSGVESGALLSLDARTGDEQWRWPEEAPAFASPVITELSGVRQIVAQSRKACCGLSLADGGVLWKIPIQADYQQNVVTPVMYDESIIFSGLNKGISRYRIEKREEQWRADEIWSIKEVSPYLAPPIVGDERLFGFSQKKHGQLFALDLTTGQTLWTSDGRLADDAALDRTGSVLWCLTNKGELILFRESEKEFDPVAHYRVSETSTWAQPAILPEGVLIKGESALLYWRFKKAAKPRPKPAPTTPEKTDAPEKASAKSGEKSPDKSEEPKSDDKKDNKKAASRALPMSDPSARAAD